MASPTLWQITQPMQAALRIAAYSWSSQATRSVCRKVHLERNPNLRPGTLLARRLRRHPLALQPTQQAYQIRNGEVSIQEGGLLVCKSWAAHFHYPCGTNEITPKWHVDQNFHRFHSICDTNFRMIFGVWATDCTPKVPYPNFRFFF